MIATSIPVDSSVSLFILSLFLMPMIGIHNRLPLKVYPGYSLDLVLEPVLMLKRWAVRMMNLNIIVYDALGDYETIGGEAPRKGRDPRTIHPGI